MCVACANRSLVDVHTDCRKFESSHLVLLEVYSQFYHTSVVFVKPSIAMVL